MSKQLVGFSVRNDLLNTFNETVPRNYRYRKIREYLRNMDEHINIKAEISKDVSIYPIRLDEMDQIKLNAIIVNNSSKGNKISGSDIMGYIIKQIISMPIRIRDTMHTS